MSKNSEPAIRGYGAEWWSTKWAAALWALLTLAINAYPIMILLLVSTVAMSGNFMGSAAPKSIPAALISFVMVLLGGSMPLMAFSYARKGMLRQLIGVGAVAVVYTSAILFLFLQ